MQHQLILSSDMARLSLGWPSDPEPPPAPNMNAEGIVAQDITMKFSQAVKSKGPSLAQHGRAILIGS